MIVSSYTDAMTLEELKDDWPSVKRQASNLGKKLLTKMPKSRIGLNPDNMFCMAGQHRSKNGNTHGKLLTKKCSKYQQASKVHL